MPVEPRLVAALYCDLSAADQSGDDVGHVVDHLLVGPRAEPEVGTDTRQIHQRMIDGRRGEHYGPSSLHWRVRVQIGPLRVHR
jgi:hypothetical protein